MGILISLHWMDGKGEFTLIETDPDLFTLQGRMVEVEPAPGQTFDSGSPATVFSATD